MGSFNAQIPIWKLGLPFLYLLLGVKTESSYKPHSLKSLPVFFSSNWSCCRAELFVQDCAKNCTELCRICRTCDKMCSRYFRSFVYKKSRVLKCLQKRSLSQPFVSNRVKPGILPLSYTTQYIEKHKNVKYSGQLKLFPEFPWGANTGKERTSGVPFCHGIG